MLIPATDNVVKGYEIDNSLRFNDNDSAYLSRTPASAGNRKTWTWAGWVKRGNLGIATSTLFQGGNNASNTEYARLWFDSLDRLRFSYYSNFWLITSQVFRDASAYYQITLSFDTTASTTSDRIKLYVNGDLVTAFDTEAYPAQNSDQGINFNDIHYIGASFVTSSVTGYLDGYMSDVHFIDGQALTPDSFGEFGDYGEFKPIPYSGTYGTNGFKLDFKDSGTLGNDVSGNNNDWTSNNLAATDQMLDTPTNNFAVLNNIATGSGTYTEGNLKHVGGSGWKAAPSTIAVPASGKWYFEAVLDKAPWNTTFSNRWTHLGIISSSEVDSFSYNSADFWAVTDNGHYMDSTTGSDGSFTIPVVGTVLAIAYDADTGTATVYRDNVAVVTNDAVAISAAADLVFFVGNYSSAYGTMRVNFGQDSSFAGNKTAQGNADSNGIGDFYYSPPAGYLALCTQNLPEPEVIPSEHFNTVLYTGNGTSQSIVSGFATDLFWAKARSNAQSHVLFDRVRGLSASLVSNSSAAEGAADITSFNSDGVTTDATANTSGYTFVAWNWKANGSGVSNTDGSITSTLSANVAAGFSIVAYTGTGANATVGHGLSEAPDMVIIKDRSGTEPWRVWSTGYSSTGFTTLNDTTAFVSNSTVYTSAPSSSVINIGTSVSSNGSGKNYIAYCFHSVEGYSKFGSYTGNGSTDGAFVHLGFRPAYVMVKRGDSTDHWFMIDAARSEYNVMGDLLRANLSNAEFVSDHFDNVSNGFKLRGNGAGINASGGTYIFMAFAESPFKNSNAR